MACSSGVLTPQKPITASGNGSACGWVHLWPVERSVQRVVLWYCCHGLCDYLFLAPVGEREEELPHRPHHHRHRNGHRNLPLRAHLQLVGGRLCGTRGSWCLCGEPLRKSVQRRLPLRRLAPDGPAATYRAHLGHEAAGAGDEEHERQTRLGKRHHGRSGLPGGDPGRSRDAMEMVGSCHVALLLRCLQPPHWAGRGHLQAAGFCEEPCRLCALPDRRFVAHVPLRVHRQECRPRRRGSYHVRADWLLRCRRDRQGSVRSPHLGHRRREVRGKGEQWTAPPVVSEPLLAACYSSSYAGRHDVRDPAVFLNLLWSSGSSARQT